MNTVAEQVGLGFDSGHDEGRARAHEVDPTPAAVVWQGLSTYVTRVLPQAPDGAPVRRLRFLDPCAGSGVFGQQARRAFALRGRPCESVGLELREEEAPWLARNYDEFHVGDALELLPSIGPVDLVATNPAFSLIARLLPLLLCQVRSGGHVLLFGLNELGARGRESRDLWTRFPPREQWRIFGTIKFRRGKNPATDKPWGTDMRSYSWWLWESDGKGGAVPYDTDDRTARRTIELPALPSPLRRWSVFPGREDDHQVYRGKYDDDDT